MRDTVSQILIENKLQYGILIEKNKEEVVEFGDRYNLDHQGIIDSCFFENPIEMFDYLNGKKLPQMISQGRVVGVILQPDCNHVVVVFTHRDDDVLSRYKWSSSLSEKLSQLWGKQN